MGSTEHSTRTAPDTIARPTPRNRPRWSPASVAAALDRGGPPLESLARSLLPPTVEMAGRELYPWCARYSRQPTDLRNDVAQDVMLKLFADKGELLRVWEPEYGLSLRGFIKRVVRFHVLQLFRSARSNPWRNEPTTPEDLETHAAPMPSLLHQLWLWQVRDQLLEQESPHGRRLYFALFVEQRSADEIAREHGMTRDAVYQWRARFKRRAAQALGQGRKPGRFGGSSR
ncbi:MAG: helix-turn-helix domain-containing protein [Deltaproteobacteria bacterium]|nr:helix-turn-helix domain-containing protein [Deltaproteobacteria bacterium]